MEVLRYIYWLFLLFHQNWWHAKTNFLGMRNPQRNIDNTMLGDVSLLPTLRKTRKLSTPKCYLRPLLDYALKHWNNGNR